jgi:hypothetical protein
MGVDSGGGIGPDGGSRDMAIDSGGIGPDGGGRDTAIDGRPPVPASLVWRPVPGITPDSNLARVIWGSGRGDIYIGTDDSWIIHGAPGGTWTRRQLNKQMDTITALWGSGANDVYAATENAGLFRSAGDDTWNPVLLPATATATSPPIIRALWGTSPADVYAVGDGIFHLVNGAWTTAVGGTASYDAVWASGPSDVWVAENCRKLWRWQGGDSWRFESTTVVGIEAELWGSGPNDVYVASAPYNLSQGPASLLHSTGDGKWATQLSMEKLRLHALWGSGPDDIYAGGTHVNDQNVSSTAALFHSTGDGLWQEVTIGVSGLALITGLWSSGPDDVYLIGSRELVLIRGTPN